MALAKAAGSPPPLRLFFALWPDERVRRALAALGATLKRECGGREMDAGNLHATLAFLGNVPADQVDAFVGLAEGLNGERFELALDSVGYWRHNRIVWAGATEVPAPLSALADRMREAVRALRWPVDERPYMPHITLLRDARHGPQQRNAALPVWPVDEFVLVSSTHTDNGVRYAPLKRWRLGITPSAER